MNLIILLLVTMCSGRAFEDIKSWDWEKIAANVIDFIAHFDSSQFLPHLNTSGVNISANCEQDLKFTIKATKELLMKTNKLLFTKKNKITAQDMEFTLPLLDSSSKIGPGLMRGHLRSMGMFRQCRDIDYFDPTLNRSIQGEYYRKVTFTDFGWKERNSLHLPRKTVFRVFLDKKLRDHGRNGSCDPHLMSIDLCLPRSCAFDKMDRLFQSVVVPKIGNPVCDVWSVNQRIPPVVTGTYIVSFMLAVILTTCIVSSYLDYLFYTDDAQATIQQEFWWKVVLAFSLHRNIAEVFHIKEHHKGSQISSIHCIRFFSMCWVIAGHSTAMSIYFITNPLDLIAFTKTWPAQVVVNAYFSVDSFFFLSGLLLSFVWFKELYRNRRSVLGVRGWILMYAHRILRLSPPYYIVVLAYSFVFTTWLHDMPMLMVPEIEHDSCRENWWINLLYLNNYIKEEKMCYIVSWYLATDLQMFLFSPLVLLPFALGGTVAGIATCLIILFTSICLSVFHTYHYYLPPSGFKFGVHDERMGKDDDFQFWQYYQPYIRCQVYVIGIMVGYLLQAKRRLTLPRCISPLLFLLSFTTMLFLVFSLHGWIQSSHSMPLHQSALYNSLSRPLWALSLSWIVIACYYGYGGPIDSFTSWWIWVPFGRLSYCAYLVHIPVIAYTWGLNTSEKMFSGGQDLLVNNIIPAIISTYAVAVIWSALFEIPFAKIESLFIDRRLNSIPLHPPADSKCKDVIQ